MAAQVMILATNKSNPFDSNPRVFFSGSVNLGEIFSVSSLMAGEDKLGSETFVHIFDGANNVLQSVKFHTSCSQALSINDQFGAVRLKGFTAQGQCPVPAGSNLCAFFPKPKTLSMTYNRARQSQITGEIMEIIGGVEALEG